MGDRRCIIVLGAGASAGCVGDEGSHPPLWRPFLIDAIEKLVENPEARSVATKLLEQNRFLDCAEVIKVSSNDADFARFIRETFVRPRFQHSAVHEVVLALDPKIVVTTNYDEVYDHYCREGNARDGYSVCKYYEAHGLNALRSPQRVILKAHGCVADPDQIILSRSQYFDARRKYPSFYNILDGLFLVNTVLFVGCSLSDPDLQLILENVQLSAATSHSHYALLEAGTPDAVRRSFRRTYNVEFLEYEPGQHRQVVSLLEELKDAVFELRQRPT